MRVVREDIKNRFAKYLFSSGQGIVEISVAHCCDREIFIRKKNKKSAWRVFEKELVVLGRENVARSHVKVKYCLPCMKRSNFL